MNSKLRAWNLFFVGLLAVGGLVGWMIFDKDPSKLTGLAGSLGITQVGLEAGMAAKRHTSNPEVMLAEAQIERENGKNDS